MLWIGLTGCIGCGKTTVSEHFKQNPDCRVISADEMSHHIMQTDPHIHKMILERWGLDFGAMDFDEYRKLIAGKVFGQTEELNFLEKLLHPKIKQAVKKAKAKLQAEGCQLAFYDVPLLFEKSMQNQFDFIVGVFAKHENQKARLRQRNKWSDEEIQKRIHSQMPNEDKIKQCDYVINNDGSLIELKSQAQEVYRKLTQSLHS